MRAEIEELRAAQRQNEQIIAALVSNKDSATSVLDQLRSGETVESISKKLEQVDAEDALNTKFRRDSDQQAIRSALRLARSIEGSPASIPTNSDRDRSTSTPRHHAEQSAITNQGGGGESSNYEGLARNSFVSRTRTDVEGLTGRAKPLISRSDPGSGTRSPVDNATETRAHGQDIILGFDTLPSFTGRWTNVTPNIEFVNHIMALYFCWEYPTFASLNKEHFLDDYRTGSTRYCSSLLVNTILALGCRLSNHAEARSDPYDGSTAGDHFFAEAVRLLELEEDKHVLTTIQALGLMSLREASCGRSSESLFHSGQSIRLAIEIGLHRDTQDNASKAAEIDHEVRSATFWGAFSLDQYVLAFSRLK